MLEQLKVIIFDWDGTLADTTPAVLCTVKRMMVERGYPEISEEVLVPYLSATVTEFAKKVFKISDSVQLSVFMEDFYALFYQEEDRLGGCLYPGTIELLTCLREKGYLLAVATNSLRVRLGRVLKNNALQPFFDFTITADEAKPKPEMLMMEKILARFNYSEAQVVMIGDTACDAEFGQKTGVKVVIIDRQLYPLSLLQKHSPWKIINNFSELRALL